MLFSRKKTGLSVLLGLTLTSFSTLAASEPEFLEFYPECGYEVIDTLEYRDMIRGNWRGQFNKTAQAYISQKLEGLHEEMLEDAKKLGAKYLLIKDRELKAAHDNSMRFFVNVEYISTCDNPHELKGEMANFDSLGNKLVSFGKMKVGEKKTITVEIPEKIKRPVLSADTEVSLESGIYGVPIGATKDEVLESFGSPSLISKSDSGHEILAYGRRHWLTFQDNKLVSVKYGSAVFNEELINYIAFDNRFDEREWQLQHGIKRNAILEDGKEQSANSFPLEQGEQSLSLATQIFLLRNQEERTRRAVGFELKHNKATDFVFSNTQLVKADNQTYLYNGLKGIDEYSDIQANALHDLAIGVLPAENGKHHLLLDATTLIETRSDKVERIYLSPSYIKGVKQKWKFGDFYAGQAVDDALEIAGDRAFQMYDVIEIENDRYTMKLYSEEDNGEETLYAMEVVIY